MQIDALQRQIIDAAYEGIWLLDLDGRTTFVNQRMAELLGYTREEMAERSLFDFMADSERAAAEQNMLRRRQNISEQHEFRFQRKDGTELWTMIAASPLR
jgi:PAS domain S-box-containing protein